MSCRASMRPRQSSLGNERHGSTSHTIDEDIRASMRPRQSSLGNGPLSIPF